MYLKKINLIKIIYLKKINLIKITAFIFSFEFGYLKVISTRAATNLNKTAHIFY